MADRLAEYPKVGTCWVCVEDDDDWAPRIVVDYDMAGDRCESHVDVVNGEQITDPILIEAVSIIVDPDRNRSN